MKKIYLIAFLLVTQIVFGQQYARPNSDITTPVDWTGTYTSINDVTANDATYGWSANDTDDSYEVSVNTVTDPLTGVDHIIRFRFAQTDDGVVSSGGTDSSLSVYLYQGVTLIASFLSFTPLTTWATRTETLTTTEANTITDYTNLRLRFDYVGGGGSPTNRRGVGLSWAELEVPDAPAPSTRRIFNIN